VATENWGRFDVRLLAGPASEILLVWPLFQGACRWTLAKYAVAAYKLSYYGGRYEETN
jgi:hypothetical protein